MKKSYLLFLISFFLLPLSLSYGQFFVENFDYPAGDSLTQHGWVAHSGGTTNAILVTSPGLTYPDYPGSGIGNAATLTVSGQDVNQQFTPLTTGSIYASLMVNVSTAQTGDYFFHLGLANTTSIYMGRVYVKQASNGNLQFGLSKTSLGGTLGIQAVYSDSIYTTGTTYLLVLKYTFYPDVNDDSVYLFINPSITLNEPTPDLIHGTSNSDDPANIGGVYIRQGSSSSASNITLDGIRIGTAWADILPVELTSFTATTQNNNVILNWTTATEINNAGFEIQKILGNNVFVTIGYVPGHGTTSESQDYKFTDANLASGSYTYRLKQIDYNGTFSYSSEVNVDVTAPVQFALAQNYPNPFNPSTKINFSLAVDSKVSLKIFNVLGQEIATIINSNLTAGSYQINFDALSLNSGVYMYRIEANGIDGSSFLSTRKMILTK